MDTQETHQAFIALIRDEADPWDYDNDSAWGALTAHLKDCDWPEFYDFVELVGALLLKKDDDGPFNETEYFKGYQTKVNALLQEDGVGWSLNDKSELHRQIPKSLAKRVALTESELADRFATARVHYQKATISISTPSTKPTASKKSSAHSKAWQRRSLQRLRHWAMQSS